MTNDLFRPLSSVINYRQKRRQFVFDRQVKPVMDGIRETHNTFLDAGAKFQRLRIPLSGGSRLSEEEFQDWQKSSSAILEDVQETMNSGREARASLFQRAKVYNSTVPKHRVVFNGEERNLLRDFYANVRLYFRWDEYAYHHEIRAHGMALEAIVGSASSDVPARKLDNALNEISMAVKYREDEFVKSWSLISESFYRIEAIVSHV